MLTQAQQAVAKFQTEVAGHQLPLKPSPISYDKIRLSLRLINEEFQELTEAMWKLDPQTQAKWDDGGVNLEYINGLAEIADGLVDLIYVIFNAANFYGIDLGPIFEEIQHSNMTKVGGYLDKRGKWIKPDTYSPADLKTEIAIQLFGVQHESQSGAYRTIY